MHLRPKGTSPQQMVPPVHHHLPLTRIRACRRCRPVVAMQRAETPVVFRSVTQAVLHCQRMHEGGGGSLATDSSRELPTLFSFLTMLFSPLPILPLAAYSLLMPARGRFATLAASPLTERTTRYSTLAFQPRRGCAGLGVSHAPRDAQTHYNHRIGYGSATL